MMGPTKLFVAASAVWLLLLHPLAHGSGLTHPSPAQLGEVAALIEKHYVRAISRDSLTAAAQACFAGKLDRYTMYLDSTETLDFERSLAGRFGGIGIGINADSTSGNFYVPWLLKGSTALQAGVQAGDTLVSVDGFATRGLGFDDLVAHIRGRVGTRVKVVIHRRGKAGELRFTIRRAVVETPTVRPLRIAPSEAQRYLADERSGIAYVRIENFNRRTTAELAQALATVARIQPRALVLDLRDNSGGWLRAAIATADEFLDSGTILTQRIRGRADHVIRAHHGGAAIRLPLVVLVNANTASAAEIVAAALQDNRRATVVGSRSFGKGVALELYHLKQAPGLLKLTTSISLRPSGGMLECHIPELGVVPGGVWPDSAQTVTLAEDEERRWSDTTFQTTRRMQADPAEPDTVPGPPDRVLDRAVELLSRAAATLSSQSPARAAPR